MTNKTEDDQNAKEGTETPVVTEEDLVDVPKESSKKPPKDGAKYDGGPIPRR